jgi:ubiquinone/menaquinone biosynthesis C-methylase UbiE
MDPASLDPKILAQQLLKPEGGLGEEVGEMMAKRHVEAMSLTFEYLQVQPSDHVLEIGFGPGEGIAEAVRQTPRGFVAGIDFSQAMYQMATRRNHRSIMEEHVELTLGDAQNLPYEDDSFDKIFAMNVFHFWSEPLRELAECRRVLKKGGLLLFYVTHHSAWIQGISDTGIFIAYEPQGVEKILSEADLRDVKSHVTVLNERKCFVVWGRK